MWRWKKILNSNKKDNKKAKSWKANSTKWENRKRNVSSEKGYFPALVLDKIQHGMWKCCKNDRILTPMLQSTRNQTERNWKREIYVNHCSFGIFWNNSHLSLVAVALPPRCITPRSEEKVKGGFILCLLDAHSWINSKYSHDEAVSSPSSVPPPVLGSINF